MVPFRVAGIPAELARQARTTLKSPQYGHPAHVEVAAGYGPCRSCLATFETGWDERILFTYDPFAGVDPYPSPGPIFIHREECPVWDAEAFPPALRHLPLTFEGYGADRWIVARERVTDGEVETTIERLLADPKVQYIQSAMLAEATRPHEEQYGYGVGVQGEGPLRSYGHGGGFPEMNGEFLVLPQFGYVVVCLSNLDPPAAFLPGS